MHDAYGKILKHIDEIEEPDSPRTKRYLVVTVRNTCFDYLLRSVPTEELAEYKAVQDNPLNTVWDDFSANEIKEKLILFLERLSDIDRNLFIDAVIRGYRHKELAEKYHLSEQTYLSKFSGFGQVSKISGTGGLRDGASKRTFYTIYGK